MITIIIFFSSFVATALSSMSGGGASVINVPVLLWLGVSFPFALCAQQINSAVWVLPASHNYLKGRKVDWFFLVLFALIGLIGVYLGILFVLKIDQRIIQIVIGILILILVVYTYFKKDAGIREQKVYSKFRQSIAYFFALILGFYESFFGSGNGILLSVITFYTRGFDFIDALGYYFAIAFPWVVFAASFLVYKGYADISIIVPTVLGGLIGGYVGSKYARFKGNKFIKMMFVVIGGFLGIKLLLGF